MKTIYLRWLLAISFSFASYALAQSQTDQIIEAGRERLSENQQAQNSINTIAAETDTQIQKFQENLKIVDGLKIYNELLNIQIDDQTDTKARLEASIANATVIERQIVPLLMDMTDGLERFVKLDVPFLMEERLKRVTKLRVLLRRADVSVAEKSRRVFEAYQIENEYGRTIEAYKGKLDLASKSFDVDYLRVGRIALMYRSVGNDQFGYWDVASGDWVPVTSNQYKRNINNGLKMARQEMAPSLVAVPVAPAKEAAL